MIFIVLFGVSFKGGCVLVHVVAWNGFLTDCLKKTFLLPRPSYVDLNVKLLNRGGLNPTHFESMGAKSFFGGLPSQAVEYIRAHPFGSWGFPSAHASHAVALWGTIFVFFQRIWVRIIAVAMIFFISVSRIYLGWHFLADIIGGLLVGFIMVLVFNNLVFRSEKLGALLFEEQKKVRFDLRSVLLFIYLLVIPLIILCVAHMEPKNVASILGFNIGFLFVRYHGIPKDSGKVLQRIARVLIAGIVFFTLHTVLEKSSGILFLNEPRIIEFIRYTVTLFLFFWGSTEICVKLGLFKR